MVMKQLSKILCLLLVLSFLAGCGQTETKTAASEPASGAVVSNEAVKTRQALEEIRALGQSPDDNYRTWYEVFVYSFCDSDGNGIGDLKGLTSKLDYIQELGFNGIWLMPIHPSVSYHKYDVSDYYGIDPDYGTMEDFEAFMAECEKRDIHVILDLVLNHTGSEHPWFQKAYSYMQSLPEGAEPNFEACPEVSYYFFDKTQKAAYYYPVAGTEWFYEGKFWSGMPDLNLENPILREEIRNIMQYWLDKGVSGFRLDAAKEYFSDVTSRNVEVLSFLMDTLTAIKPDGYMVAEVWTGYTDIADYYKSGITSIFNFPFGDGSGKISSVLRGIGQEKVISSYATALEKVDAAFSASNPDYIDAPFLSNHDTGRISGFCSGDVDKIKLAGAMNLLMSGSAFVYYGEELGMPGSGNDPSKRAPMTWNEARNDGTTNPPPECTLPESYPLGSYEVQKDDDASVYNYYRQAIAIRQALPLISHGKTTAEAALNKGSISAQHKTWENQECIILMNIDTGAASVDLSQYADYHLAASLVTGEEEVTVDGAVLSLPAYGVAILLR